MRVIQILLTIITLLLGAIMWRLFSVPIITQNTLQETIKRNPRGYKSVTDNIPLVRVQNTVDIDAPNGIEVDAHINNRSPIPVEISR